MPAAFFPGFPDFAIEVTSPDDTDRDIQDKVLQYLTAGTPRVWVVRPETLTVTVYRQGGDAHVFRAGDTLTSDDAGFPVDGFTLGVEAIFS